MEGPLDSVLSGDPRLPGLGPNQLPVVQAVTVFRSPTTSLGAGMQLFSSARMIL